MKDLLDAHIPLGVRLGRGHKGLYDTINNSLHFQLGLALASLGVITSLVAQHMYSLPAYAFISQDFTTQDALYTHHQYIAGFRIPDYSYLNRIICTGQYNLVYSPILHENYDLLSKRRRNKFIIPLHSIQELENELMPYSGISIEIPVNGNFRRNKQKNTPTGHTMCNDSPIHDK